MNVASAFFCFGIFIVIVSIISCVYSAWAENERKTDIERRISQLGEHHANRSTVYLGGLDIYLDGKLVTTCEERDEWYAIKGFVDSLHYTCREIEKRMEKGESEDFQADKEQWHKFYARLRQNCIAQRMHNPEFEGRMPFYPTKQQLEAENELYAKIDRLCIIGTNLKNQNGWRKEQILNRMESVPGHVISRQQLVNQLAGSSKVEREAFRNVCKSLCNTGVLEEAHSDDGKLLIRKPKNYKKKQEKELAEIVSAPRSPVSYGKIPYRIICKVRRTVGFPENLDRENCTCQFQSLAREARYNTSLSSCTCQSFKNGEAPCKHMVALAGALGIIEL